MEMIGDNLPQIFIASLALLVDPDKKKKKTFLLSIFIQLSESICVAISQNEWSWGPNLQWRTFSFEKYVDKDIN